MNVSRIVFLLSVLALVSCSTGPSELRLVVGGLEVNQPILRGLAEHLGQGDHVPVRLVEKGEDGALDMLAQGQADLALVENTVSFQQGITSVMPIYTGVLQIGYRGDRGPEDDPATALGGARIFAGSPDSLSYELMRRFLSYSGQDQTGAELSTEFDRDNLPDVFAVFGPIDRERALNLEGYRLHSMGTPEDIGQGSLVDGIRKSFPQLRPYVIPVGTYGKLTQEPVVTRYMVIGRPITQAADPAAVYDLVEQMVAARPALAAQFPSVYDGMRTDFEPGTLNFPLHPGAQRYLDRDEPTVYERFADVVDAGVTVFLALLSGVLALMRYLTVRRKNRIDEFYARLLAMRDQARAEPSTRGQVISEVQALEDEAFRQLIDEKLSANESFRIFVTLAHDVLRELREPAPRPPTRANDSVV